MESPQAAPVPPAVPSTPAPAPVIKHSKLPIILFVLVLLILVGSGGVFLGKQMARPTAISMPAVASPSVSVDQTADWATHSSTEYGFEIKYPPYYTKSGGMGVGDTLLVSFANSQAIANFNISLGKNSFSMVNLRKYAPTGLEDIDPVLKTINGKSFYYYGPGGGGVNYPDQFFYDANGKIFVFTFIGPYENDKTPSPATKTLETQILSTFKFTDAAPTVKPTSKPLTSVPLLDTSTWLTGSVANVSFKYPADFTSTLNQNSNMVSKPAQYGNIYFDIRVYTYDGGSRRQWFIDYLHTNGGDSLSSIEKYTLAKEIKLGSVDALDFWMDPGWWQGGGTSPIIIASGKTIVTITPNSGRTYDPATGIISRIQILDTIGSTIKFN